MHQKIYCTSFFTSGLEDIVSFKNRPLVLDKQVLDPSDAPPCKRPLLDHSTNIKADVDCDKYSFRSTNLKLPSEQLSLSLPPDILPTENNKASNINESEKIGYNFNEVI